MRPLRHLPKVVPANHVRRSAPLATALGQRRNPSDPDLALIVERWFDLPPAVRAGIVAMVKASGSGGQP
jgi:hypothetical protein